MVIISTFGFFSYKNVYRIFTLRNNPRDRAPFSPEILTSLSRFVRRVSGAKVDSEKQLNAAILAGHTSSIRLECSAARAPPSQGVKYIFVK